MEYVWPRPLAECPHRRLVGHEGQQVVHCVVRRPPRPGHAAVVQSGRMGQEGHAFYHGADVFLHNKGIRHEVSDNIYYFIKFIFTFPMLQFSLWQISQAVR